MEPGKSMHVHVHELWLVNPAAVLSLPRQWSVQIQTLCTGRKATLPPVPLCAPHTLQDWTPKVKVIPCSWLAHAQGYTWDETHGKGSFHKPTINFYDGNVLNYVQLKSQHNEPCNEMWGKSFALGEDCPCRAHDWHSWATITRPAWKQVTPIEEILALQGRKKKKDFCLFFYSSSRNNYF